MPTEQLVQEVAPNADLGLPPPVSEQISADITRYTVPLTKPGAWGKLVGSPAPLRAILARATRRLTDVEVLVKDLLELPSQPPELPPDQIVYSLFSVEIENALPEDFSVGHVTMFVEKTWLDANEVHKWSIQFNRLDELAAAWVPSPSKRVREDEDRVFYTVVVPGFSVIAITGSRELPKRVFQVTDLSIRPSSPVVGQDLTVTARVANTSETRAVYHANLWIDDTIEAIQAIWVDAGQTSPVVFTVGRPVGTYRVRVERLLGRFSVGAPATPTPVPPPATPTPVPSAGLGGGTAALLVIGVLVAAVAGGLAVLAYVRRRPPAGPPPEAGVPSPPSAPPRERTGIIQEAPAAPAEPRPIEVEIEPEAARSRPPAGPRPGAVSRRRAARRMAQRPQHRGAAPRRRTAFRLLRRRRSGGGGQQG